MGIVFRQHYPFVNAVTLDDVYGTLDLKDSPLTIDLPGVDWKLPLKDLPALSVTLGNMAAEKDQTVGFLQSSSTWSLTSE